MSFEEIVKDAAKEGAKAAFTRETVEDLAFSKFDNKIISLQTTAEILGVHPDTVRSYIKYKLIDPEPRLTEKSPYKFQLSMVLKLRKENLK